MKTATGWVQGYNAQAAVNEYQVVVACAVTQDANDVGQYEPMVGAAEAALAAVGIVEPIGIVLADAGYWSEGNANGEGPQRLIATVKDWKQRRAACDMGTTTGPPPEHASALEAMEHRLRTAEGTQTYARRSHTVEPVFADTKENPGLSPVSSTGPRRRPQRVGADEPQPQPHQALQPPGRAQPRSGLNRATGAPRAGARRLPARLTFEFALVRSLAPESVPGHHGHKRHTNCDSLPGEGKCANLRMQQALRRGGPSNW